MSAEKATVFAKELKATFPNLNATVEKFDDHPFTHKVMIWMKDFSFEVYFDGLMLYRTNHINTRFNGINDALDWAVTRILALNK